jgi:type IV pilus assembly protein PilX
MRGQNGVVMIVALVVLVVMTLAGIALMRSMDTTNLIAGNMAFKQAATHTADAAVEAAVGWLETNNASGSYLKANHADVGYKASTAQNNAYPLGDAFWTQFSAGNGVCYLPIVGGVCSAAPGVANASGNTMAFMIQRLCPGAGDALGCAVVTGTTVTSGSNEGAGDDQLSGVSTSVYYRITVRVVGPRNSVSYVQTIVYM